MKDVAGKVCVVTGGASGIGRALADKCEPRLPLAASRAAPRWLLHRRQSVPSTAWSWCPPSAALLQALDHARRCGAHILSLTWDVYQYAGMEQGCRGLVIGDLNMPDCEAAAAELRLLGAGAFPSITFRASFPLVFGLICGFFFLLSFVFSNKLRIFGG